MSKAKKVEKIDVLDLDLESLEGLSKSEIITDLMIESSFNYGDAIRVYKDYFAGKASGFKARFYERLIEGDLSEDDFKAFISDESENVVKKAKNFDRVRVLANTIRANALGEG